MPSYGTILPGEGFTFSYTGGTAPVLWEILYDSTCDQYNNCSTIDASTGVFRAGPTWGWVIIQALDANGEMQFANLTDWGHANTYAFGPSITLPIFEGGRLTHTLELREAQQQEAAVTYQRTVLNALHEVDNALTAYQNEQRRSDRLQQAVEQNRRALGLARDRYADGLVDFLQVLDAQRNLLAAQQQLTDSTTLVSTDMVQIYKELGGGWQTDLPDAPPDATKSTAR